MQKRERKKPTATPSRLVKIAAAAGAGLAALAVLFGNYEKICKFADQRLGTNICFLPPATLVIAPFAANGRPAPGNEHVLKTAPPSFKDSFAFQSGAKLATALGSSAEDDQTITVSAIALKLVDYTAGDIASLNYDFGLSNLAGKGISEALFYRVSLVGNSVRVSEVNSADGTFKPIDAPDLLGRRQINLKGKGESQIIKLELIPRKDGLYTVQLDVDWSSKGQMQHTKSQSVYLYRHED
jgi:hypothetical protein